MNKKAYFLLILAVFLLLSACSSEEGENVNVTEVVELEGLSPDEKEKLFRSSGVILRENQALAENLSRIETSRNAQGIKTERYYYANIPNLKYIEVFTLANGQKQIFIHNENGNVKSLSENSLAWLARASPAEITGDVSPVAAEQQKENPSSGGIKINTLPPIVVNKATPLPESNQTVEAPKTEKPNEANTKTDAPVEKKDSSSGTTSPDK